MENPIVTETPTINQIIEPVNKPKFPVIIFIVSILILLAIIGAYWLYIKQPKTSTQNNAQQAKFCEGVDIIFFPGGNESDSFASVVYNGAKEAQNTLGANVTYVWSDWDSDKMVSQFKDAISTSPDAIAIMGHPGAAALSSLVDEAERKNIIVTMQNVDITSIREKYTSNGFGYVGQTLYSSGLLVSNGVIRKYQPNEGTEAIVFGVDPTTDPSRYERTKGVVDGLEKGKLVVHEIPLSLEVQKDTKSPSAQTMFSDALIKYPNAKIIIIDHGSMTAQAPLILKNLGKQPGDYIIAGFDLSADTIKSIKEGYIGLISDQQPYLQGFLPVLQSCLTKKYQFAGLYIDTGVGLIDSSNIDMITGLVEQGIR